MLPISDGKRDVYGPDTLQVMGAAFDAAVQLLPPNLKDHERTRRRLALLILHHTDRGEPAGVLAISRARFPESDSIAFAEPATAGLLIGIDRRLTSPGWRSQGFDGFGATRRHRAAHDLGDDRHRGLLLYHLACCHSRDPNRRGASRLRNRVRQNCTLRLCRCRRAPAAERIAAACLWRPSTSSWSASWCLRAATVMPSPRSAAPPPSRPARQPCYRASTRG